MERMTEWRGLCISDRECRLGMVILSSSTVEVVFSEDGISQERMEADGYLVKAFLEDAAAFPLSSIPGSPEQTVFIRDAVLYWDGKRRYIFMAEYDDNVKKYTYPDDGCNTD